jgi:iodotyrosine deiodinase
MTASLIPLPAYRSFEPDEMLERATSFREELGRRRTVRDFSDRPVDLRIIEQCLLTAGFPRAQAQGARGGRSRRA